MTTINALFVFIFTRPLKARFINSPVPAVKQLKKLLKHFVRMILYQSIMILKKANMPFTSSVKKSAIFQNLQMLMRKKILIS